MHSLEKAVCSIRKLEARGESWAEHWLRLSWDMNSGFCQCEPSSAEGMETESKGPGVEEHSGCLPCGIGWALQKKKKERRKRDVLWVRSFLGTLWLSAQSLKTSPRKGVVSVPAFVPLGSGNFAVLSVSPNPIHKLNLWSSSGIFFFNGSDGLAFSGWMTFLFQSRQLRRVWEAWLDQALRKCFH